MYKFAYIPEPCMRDARERVLVQKLLHGGRPAPMVVLGKNIVTGVSHLFSKTKTHSKSIQLATASA